MTLEDVLAAALRWPDVMRRLAPVLTSDLVVANVFQRQIMEFSAEFLDQYGSLPKQGDWQAWIEDLSDRDVDGVRDQLRKLLDRDLSSFTPAYVADHAGATLREAAAGTVIGRLQRVGDGGGAEAIREFADRLEAIGNLQTDRGLGTVGSLSLADVESRRVCWLWPGRIPLGTLTVLDGDPGLGKSTLLLDLAARLSAGQEMPDGSESEPGGPVGTVLMTAEDSLEYSVAPRIDVAGGDRSRIHVFQTVRYDGDREPRFPHIRDVEALEKVVSEVDARLVVVDPLMAYLPSDADSYRDADIRRTLTPLIDLADRLGFAVVAVRHLRKASAKRAMYRGGGSIGIVAAARSGLLVAPDPNNEEYRALVSTKQNLAPEPPALRYVLHSFPHEVSGMVPGIIWGEEADLTAEQLLDPPDSETRSAREEAMAFIRAELEHGPRAVTEIKEAAKDLGLNWKTVQAAKRDINVESEKQGFDGGWIWKLSGEADDG